LYSEDLLDLIHKYHTVEWCTILWRRRYRIHRNVAGPFWHHYWHSEVAILRNGNKDFLNFFYLMSRWRRCKNTRFEGAGSDLATDIETR
jgi:hypothetical protein